MLRHKPLITLAAVFALLAIGLSCGHKPKGVLVTPVNGLIKIDAARVGKGEVKFFRHDAGGKDIEFFIARTADGEVKTAFDACRTCYTHHMGYRQDGDKVLCVYCGITFRIDELSEGKGNCVPVMIGNRIEGGSIVIDQKEIEAGAQWF